MLAFVSYFVTEILSNLCIKEFGNLLNLIVVID